MARLALSLLGSLRILLDGQPVTDFAYTKARALLAFLVVEMDRPHSRDGLVGLLWPDLPDAAARTNLRQALADLRKVLGDETEHPDGAKPFLLVTRDTIQFNATSDYDLDVTTFSQLLDATGRHRHRHIDRCPACSAHLEQALAYYRGDLLAGFMVGNAAPFEEWMGVKREALHQQAQNALEHLANFYERRQQYEQARTYIQQQLVLEPWREEAHQQLMRLYASSGQRSAALAQYATCRQILQQELGVEPSATTTALYTHLCSGEALSAEKLIARPRHGVVLPIPPAPLVNREADLTHLADLLANPSCHLITLTGPGGIGKTRLALAATVQQAGAFLHGAVFVDLSGVTSARFLPDAILAALDVPLQGQQSPSQQLRTYLRDLELLVVLDNYEQLLPNVELLTELVRQAPAVTWLVTSRERLAMQAEHLMELAGLSYPQPGQSHLRSEPEEVAANYPAVRLFLQRVHQTERHFAATAKDIAAMVRICRVTEGMPLALELAAAAVRLQSCATIATALENGQLRLTTNLRDLPERHLSIHAAFEHSWQLLLPDERRVFGALSVFRGGFPAEAGHMVAGASSKVLPALMDKSLIHHHRDPSGSGRYGMHELIRQFAEEKLVEAGEQETTHYRHLEFFVQMAEEAEPKLRSSEQQHWLDLLESEHDNLRAALERAIAYQWSEMAAHLAGALSRFWFIRVHVHEGREFLERICASAPFADPNAVSSAAARVFNGAGWLAFLQGEYAQAVVKFERGLALAQRTHDTGAIANALRGLALQAMNQGNPLLAQDLAQQSLDVARTAGDTWLAGAALNVLGDLARGAGDYQAAALLFEESQQLLRIAGDSSRMILVQCNAGWVALALGEDGRAKAMHQQVVRLAYAMGYLRPLAHGLNGVASVLVRSQQRDQVKLATQLLGAAGAVRERANIPLEVIDRSDYDSCIAMAQSMLDREAFMAAWTEGQVMALEQAVAYALADGE